MQKAIEAVVRIFCCKPRNGYKYVHYEDDVVFHNNVLYDMRNINFVVPDQTHTRERDTSLPSYAQPQSQSQLESQLQSHSQIADRDWRNCDLYENKEE
jgi:hypothetical protein